MVCEVLPYIGTDFEMLQLLPPIDSLIYSVLVMMTGDHLKIRNMRFILTQLIFTGITLTYQNLVFYDKRRHCCFVYTCLAWRTTVSSQTVSLSPKGYRQSLRGTLVLCKNLIFFLYFNISVYFKIKLVLHSGQSE